MGGIAYSDTDDPVEMFRNAVITLTTKGNVEEYMKPIIGRLKNGINDMAVLNEMIDILFDHVSNFETVYWCEKSALDQCKL